MRAMRRAMMHRLHFLAVGKSGRILAETFATDGPGLLIVEEIAHLVTMENVRRYHLRMDAALFIAEQKAVDPVHSSGVGEGRGLQPFFHDDAFLRASGDQQRSNEGTEEFRAHRE